MNDDLIRCDNCHGFEFHMIPTKKGVVVKCWTCGDKLTLKEVHCMVYGHKISADQASKFNDTVNRIETVCDNCGIDVIVRQSPTDKEKYFITEIHSRV